MPCATGHHGAWIQLHVIQFDSANTKSKLCSLANRDCCIGGKSIHSNTINHPALICMLCVFNRLSCAVQSRVNKIACNQ